MTSHFLESKIQPDLPYCVRCEYLFLTWLINNVTAEGSYRLISGFTLICKFSGVYLEGASNYFNTVDILRNNFWRDFLFT